jgi:hypothetical protein
MPNLREIVEFDLATTLEGDFALPVELVAGDTGIEYTGLLGQVLYDSRIENPVTGGEESIHKPVVTLRRSSLTRIPVSGEKWVVRIPLTPSTTAPLEPFSLEIATEGGDSIGFIRLYLMKPEQSS